MAFGELSLKGRALRWLAQREHSRVELERKLARHALPAEDDPDGTLAQARIAAVLDELSAAGLLSDERTAQSVLRSQGARFGSRRLQHTLQHKGLAPALVAQTVADARQTDLARARAVYRRRFGAPGGAGDVPDLDGGADDGAPVPGVGGGADEAPEGLTRGQRREAAAQQAAARAKVRSRQARFLIARGFDAATVRQVLAEAGAGAEPLPGDEGS